MTDPRARLAESLALLATPDAFFIPGHQSVIKEQQPDGASVWTFRGIGYNDRIDEMWAALGALGWVGPYDASLAAAIPDWQEQRRWLAATDVAGLRCWLAVVRSRERIVDGLWGSAIREGHFALIIGRLLREG